MVIVVMLNILNIKISEEADARNMSEAAKVEKTDLYCQRAEVLELINDLFLLCLLDFNLSVDQCLTLFLTKTQII
jgi:hypothetical protein